MCKTCSKMLLYFKSNTNNKCLEEKHRQANRRSSPPGVRQLVRKAGPQRLVVSCQPLLPLLGCPPPPPPPPAPLLRDPDVTKTWHLAWQDSPDFDFVWTLAFGILFSYLFVICSDLPEAQFLRASPLEYPAGDASLCWCSRHPPHQRLGIWSTSGAWSTRCTTASWKTLPMAR